jgi:hypothetical protein
LFQNIPWRIEIMGSKPDSEEELLEERSSVKKEHEEGAGVDCWSKNCHASLDIKDSSKIEIKDERLSDDEHFRDVLFSTEATPDDDGKNDLKKVLYVETIDISNDELQKVLDEILKKSALQRWENLANVDGVVTTGPPTVDEPKSDEAGSFKDWTDKSSTPALRVKTELKLEEKTKKFSIIVKSFDNVEKVKTIKIVVNGTKTVRKVKQKYSKKIGLSSYFDLKFLRDDGWEELDDNTRIEDIGDCKVFAVSDVSFPR